MGERCLGGYAFVSATKQASGIRLALSLLTAAHPGGACGGGVAALRRDYGAAAARRGGGADGVRCGGADEFMTSSAWSGPMAGSHGGVPWRRVRIHDQQLVEEIGRVLRRLRS